MVEKEVICKRCGKKWTPKKKNPITCANQHCRSAYWNIPRIYKPKRGVNKDVN